MALSRLQEEAARNYVDRDVSNGAPDECSVSCGDECPDELNPFGCGGWQQMFCEGIQFPSEFGASMRRPLREEEGQQDLVPRGL